MVAQLPALTALGPRFCRHGLDVFRLGHLRQLFLRALDPDPGSLEAYQSDIETGRLESEHFALEDLFVIAGLAQQVVRMDEGLTLFFAQILDRDRRDGLPAFRLGRHQTAVSVDHAVLAVDPDRDDHAELAEGRPQLLDLLGRVQFGVILVRMKVCDLPRFHPGDCSHVVSFV